MPVRSRDPSLIDWMDRWGSTHFGRFSVRLTLQFLPHHPSKPFPFLSLPLSLSSFLSPRSTFPPLISGLPHDTFVLDERIVLLTAE